MRYKNYKRAADTVTLIRDQGIEVSLEQAERLMTIIINLLESVENGRAGHGKQGV